MTIETSIVEEITKPSPCDYCELRTDCKTNLKACKQFFMFVNSGRVVYGQKNPTREIWRKIFIEDSEEL